MQAQALHQAPRLLARSGVAVLTARSVRPALPALPSQRISPRHSSTTSGVPSSLSSRPAFVPPPPPPGSGSGEPRRGVRPIYIFVAIAGTGIGLTLYGLYEFYSSFTTWPAELRPLIRLALKAQINGDVQRSEDCFRSALALALSLPREQLGDAALLKLSGLSIALGSFLESEGRASEAYDVYAASLELLQAPDGAQTGPERMRAVALAQKCGDLAQLPDVQRALSEGGEKRDMAETHLVWSVEELLRLTVPAEKREAALAASPATAGTEEDASIKLSELPLPAWVKPAELGASLEALAGFYSAKGQAQLAAPLYLHALSILFPPREGRTRNATAAERCRAATLMSNLALVFIASAPKDKSSANQRAREQARHWASRGLATVEKTNAMAGWDGKKPTAKVVGEADRADQVRGQCLSTELVLLYNLGHLSEMDGDKCEARTFYQRTYRRADENGQREARSRAAAALSQLERKGSY